MKIEIKQIILNESLDNLFRKVAYGKPLFGYSNRMVNRDKRVGGFALRAGVPAGAIAGQLIDSMNDGSYTDETGHHDELIGNGLVAGGIVGGVGTLGYGLNKNHKFITKNHINDAKEYLKNKFPKNGGINNQPNSNNTGINENDSDTIIDVNLNKFKIDNAKKAAKFVTRSSKLAAKNIVNRQDNIKKAGIISGALLGGLGGEEIYSDLPGADTIIVPTIGATIGGAIGAASGKLGSEIYNYSNNRKDIMFKSGAIEARLNSHGVPPIQQRRNTTDILIALNIAKKINNNNRKG